MVFVLVLRTQLVNAFAFLAGWTLALSLLFVIVLVPLAGDISTGTDHRHRTAASSGPRSRSGRRCSSSRQAGGVAATTTAVVADTRWRYSDGSTTSTSAERLSSGVLIQPRALTVAAAVIIARDRSGVLSLLIGFAVFAIVSTAALLGILTYHLWSPESATLRLTDVLSTLERQGPLIFTVLCGAGGGYLVVDGVRDLVALILGVR